MKRRQLIRYAGASLTTAIASTLISSRQSYQAQDTSESVTIQYLGHTCFLFTGNGLKVLVNPYASAGCTAGYSLPNVEPDLVLVSSFLLDEGAVDKIKGNPKVITQAGDHQFGGIKFQGVAIAHDREGGKRFGNNIAWRWNQGGIDILHLGGAAAPITTEEKILLSGPDVLLIPVGGGVKAYNPQEAKQAVDTLKPIMVIPTQYRTAAAKEDSCDLVSVDEFLALVQGREIKQVGSDRISIKPTDLPTDRKLVRVLNYS